MRKEGRKERKSKKLEGNKKIHIEKKKRKIRITKIRKGKKLP